MTAWEAEHFFFGQEPLREAFRPGPGQLDRLEVRLRELHSYETPEFLVLGVEASSHPYLEWLVSSLGSG